MTIIDYLCSHVFMNIEERLKEEILDGVLIPGQKINISLLKKRYAVSLAPLREALSALASTGLLVFEPNRGYKVAEVSEQELRDLYEISAHLECLALTQAMERGDFSWEEEIVSSLYQLERIEKRAKTPSFLEWSEVNTRFHDALISACSPVLFELRKLIHMKSTRYVRIAFGKAAPNLDDYHHQHKKLAEAVLSRAKEQAVALMKDHILNGRDLAINCFNKKWKLNA